MVQLPEWVKARFEKSGYLILALLALCALPYVLICSVQALGWIEGFFGIYFWGFVAPAVCFFLVPREKLRTLFYGAGSAWAGLILAICLVWSLHVVFRFSMVPRDWLWGYIEPGLGGLGLLVLPNLFYFGLAHYVGTGPSIPKDRVRFCLGLFLFTTVCMIYGFHNWINGLLDYNTELLYPQLEPQ